jgi:hypothetical protein
MGRQQLAFRVKRSANERAHPAHVRAIDKAGLRIKACGNVVELSVIFPGARAALNQRMVCRA